MRKIFTLASAGLAALALAATPASAKNDKKPKDETPAPTPSPTPSPTPTPTSITLPPIVTQCKTVDISPTAMKCSGFFAGNQLGNSKDMREVQGLALFDLGFTGAVVRSETLGLNGKEINFKTLLFGITYVGLHFGGAIGDNGTGEQSTAFYKFDAGETGLDIFTITALGGSSNAVLFATGEPDVTTPVPEPAAWAMMILAAGMAGGSLRAKRRTALPIG